MRPLERFAILVVASIILPSISPAQVSLLWESPTINGETGTLYSPADSSYSYAYTIDTIANQMKLYSTSTFTAAYTMSGVRPYEYPAYLLPDMNGNGAPEVILQYYSLPGYSVSIRDASTGQVLNSWSDAANSYYIWQVFQSRGSRTLKLAMRKTNVTTLAASFVVYSLGVSANGVSSPDGRSSSELMLDQNYPNPFNPSTIIRYEIPATGSVQLSVYDAAGHLVRIFDTERQDAGSHQVSWNGRNDRGIPVASGVYFYTLSVDNMIHTKKMILLR